MRTEKTKRSLPVRCAARVGLALMVIGWAPNVSFAAGSKPALKDRLNERSDAQRPRPSKHCSAGARSDDAALGPVINYPSAPCRFSSSSERHFTGGEVNAVPFRSPAEALEIVPGLAVGH
jgi:hypothetical protein